MLRGLFRTLDDRSCDCPSFRSAACGTGVVTSANFSLCRPPSGDRLTAAPASASAGLACFTIPPRDGPRPLLPHLPLDPASTPFEVCTGATFTARRGAPCRSRGLSLFFHPLGGCGFSARRGSGFTTVLLSRPLFETAVVGDLKCLFFLACTHARTHGGGTHGSGKQETRAGGKHKTGGESGNKTCVYKICKKQPNEVEPNSEPIFGKTMIIPRYLDECLQMRQNNILPSGPPVGAPNAKCPQQSTQDPTRRTVEVPFECAVISYSFHHTSCALDGRCPSSPRTPPFC